ncbi:MAG TPA: phosphatase PAP2 family protein [Sulfuricaulis sp.]|nr:phosphatase PAP2 family protein [Sulfuricaulis sp.]
MKYLRWVVPLAITACVLCSTALASGGPLGIDHRVTQDDNGIWQRKYQQGLMTLMIGGEIVGAVWEGGETRLGKTFWQSIDASVLGGLSAEVLKVATSRKRPSETDNPNEFFSGDHHRSFPSGEVTTASSIVTPFVAEYREDHPSVYALEILPAYDMVARVKVWGHWQTDVLAGFALGTGWGVYAHGRSQPLILSALPEGFTVGLHKKF